MMRMNSVKVIVSLLALAISSIASAIPTGVLGSLGKPLGF